MIFIHIHVCVLVTESCPTPSEPMGYTSCQAPLSMKFFRQEYCSRLPSLPIEDIIHIDPIKHYDLGKLSNGIILELKNDGVKEENLPFH